MKRTKRPLETKTEGPRTRTKTHKEENSLEAWGKIILGNRGTLTRRRNNLPEEIRARTQAAPMRLCSKKAIGECWYSGACFHKEPHLHNSTCEMNFCSMMSISCCCPIQKEPEE